MAIFNSYVSLPEGIQMVHSAIRSVTFDSKKCVSDGKRSLVGIRHITIPWKYSTIGGNIIPTITIII